MSPQEIKLTIKMSLIISIVTVALSIGASWATTNNQVEINTSGIVVLDGRVRDIERCIDADMASLRSDMTWVVNTLDRIQRTIERMGDMP